MNTSLYDQYRNLAMETPVPTLERTSAEIRDRAVADANVLRQEKAELRAMLIRAREFLPSVVTQESLDLYCAIVALLEKH